MTPTSPLLTIKESCLYLRRSRTFVWEHRAELGAVRLGRSVMFTQASLDAYIARQTVPPAAIVSPPRATVTRLAAIGRLGINPATRQPWSGTPATRQGGRAR